MPKTNKSTNQKPLTLDELAKYNQEVLIPAISEVVVTKKDAEKFATKEGLKELVTKKDAEKFATKEDLKGLVAKKDFEAFREAAMEVFATKQDLEEGLRLLEERIAEKFDKVHTHLDKVAAKLDRFGTEHQIVSARETRIVKVLDIFFEILKRHGLVVPEDIQRLTRQDILTITK